MATQQMPFRFQEVFKLTNLGLNQDLFKHGNLTFESQKYIAIKDGPSVHIVDTANQFKVDKRDMKADAILMHRDRNIIAVRADQGTQTVIQTFDMDGPKKIAQFSIPDTTQFWRWISPSKIAVVGKNSIYHIEALQQGDAQKIFDRHPDMGPCQIMNYDMDAQGQWCFVVGLYSPDQRNIAAKMQLYNVERKQQQLLEGYAGCFMELPVSENNASYKNSLFSFCEKKQNETVQRLHIMEIGNPAPGNNKFKINCEIAMDAQAIGDFPVLMQVAPKYGVLFIITKMGYFFMYETSRASLIYRQRITDTMIFAATRNTTTDGMICINKAGQIFAINVEEQNFVKYVMGASHISDNRNIAIRIASRYNLPGADEIFVAQFQQSIQAGDYAGAARAAAQCNSLRTQDTINKFKQLPAPAGGGPQPILIYFSTLLEQVRLNEQESLELCRPVLQQGKVALVEGWINNNKLTMSDELGDAIRQYNPQLALKAFQESGNPDKVIQTFVEANQFDKIVPYCQQMNHRPDFIKILRSVVPSNSQAAVGLAKMITTRDAQGNPKTPIETVTQIFLEHNKVQETTAFLLEALKGNLVNEGHLQTKLFEINLMQAPQVAEGIFQLNLFTQFDKEKIGRMCEQVGLYGRALQFTQNAQDAQRIMLNSHAIPKEIMVEFFGKLSEEDSLTCMNNLMRSNRQNGPLVAEIAVKYASKIDTKKSIQVLEQYGTNEGLLLFLCNVLPHTDDPEIYFKYIESCARMGNFKEVERVVKETTYYDPIKVRDFLMEGKFSDPRPLIYLCNIHGFIEELTKYLYTTKQTKCIDIFLFKVNTDAAPQVLGTLLDLDCDENYIKALLNSLRQCPIEQLVDQFEQRGKLRMLTAFLEARYQDRIQEPALHNALAKIYIDTGNKDVEDFLIKNQFYDSKIVGRYCEERNPDLAFVAYKRAWGSCDEELIRVTNTNLLFRKQARYLVERQSAELWATVLNPENKCRQEVIDQVVQTALPETKNVDEVANAVQAFIKADIPQQLIELLERIVLHNSDFADNRDLQNLLILTAIRSETSRVMDYINRLDNYDGIKLANMCKDPQHALFDEALVIFKKFNEPVEAIRVILYNLNNIKQASEYAEKTNKPEVFSELGTALLDQQQLVPAIEAYIKANDAKMFERVIFLAQTQNEYGELVNFLLMARKTIKDQKIDSELIYAYARNGEKYLGDLESFVSEPNQADAQKCGDRCFDDRLYQAAEILYKRVGNNQKLAQVYVKLKKYQAAFDAAKKADVPKVWKAVCFACVRAKEFRMAALCGQHVIIQPDHLEDVLSFYEKFGYVDELVQLMEQGMSLERTHNGIYTELGILYAKYTPKRLMDHIRTYNSKLMIPKLIRACEQYQMWPEAVFLHGSYEQQDQAVITMMEHSPSAWRHDLFSQNIIKVANHDLYYRAMLFYLEEEPMLLNDILKLLATKIDLTKAVQVMKRTGYIALITPFLKSVQTQNISAVNEALNEIYLENEDFESLRTSIQEYDSFESLQLAQDLENHSLLECRRISSLLYRKGKKFQKSIEISKKDDLHKDAMETVAESKDPQLAEDLLRHIMNMKDKELLASMLYTCYELVKPDVVLEVAWRQGLQEYVMPYFIQFVKDISTRVETVQKSTDDIKKKDEKKQEEEMNKPLDMGMEFMFPGMMGGMNQGPAAIMPAPGSMPMGNMGQQFQTMPNMGGNMGMNMGMQMPSNVSNLQF